MTKLGAIKLVLKGGPGSGHHGHTGSPGRGGSTAGGAGGGTTGMNVKNVIRNGKVSIISKEKDGADITYEFRIDTPSDAIAAEVAQELSMLSERFAGVINAKVASVEVIEADAQDENVYAFVEVRGE